MLHVSEYNFEKLLVFHSFFVNLHSGFAHTHGRETTVVEEVLHSDSAS